MLLRLVVIRMVKMMVNQIEKILLSLVYYFESSRVLLYHRWSPKNWSPGPSVAIFLVIAGWSPWTKYGCHGWSACPDHPWCHRWFPLATLDGSPPKNHLGLCHGPPCLRSIVLQIPVSCIIMFQFAGFDHEVAS